MNICFENHERLIVELKSERQKSIKLLVSLEMSKKVIKGIQLSLIDEAIARLKKKIYSLTICLQQIEEAIDFYTHLIVVFSETGKPKPSCLLVLEPGLPSEWLVKWRELSLRKAKAVLSWGIFEALLKQLKRSSEDAKKNIRPSFLLTTIFSTGPPGKKHLLKIFVSLRRVLFGSDIL